jgi:hypothetical protein
MKRVVFDWAHACHGPIGSIASRYRRVIGCNTDQSPVDMPRADEVPVPRRCPSKSSWRNVERQSSSTSESIECSTPCMRCQSLRWISWDMKLMERHRGRFNPNWDSKTTAILPRNLRGIQPGRAGGISEPARSGTHRPLGSSGLDVSTSTALSAQGSPWCKLLIVKGSPFWGTRPILN